MAETPKKLSLGELLNAEQGAEEDEEDVEALQVAEEAQAAAEGVETEAAAPAPVGRKEKLRAIFGDSDDEEVLPTRKPKEKKPKKDKKEKGAKRKGKADGAAAAGAKKPKKEKAEAKREGGGEELFKALDASDDEDDGGAAAEDGFIDDHGAASRDMRDDVSVDASEAEEDDGENLDALFEKKKSNRKKSQLSTAENKSFVEAFLGRMEAAAEDDVEAHKASRPAIHKLQLLRQVEDTLEKTQLHEDLLEAGLLNILNAWLRPLADGSIPNVSVRTTLLRLLKKLPVNVEMFDRREQLKKSGLGKMVMFLYKLPEETLQNKRVAQALVEAWSRPIFELSTQYSDLKHLQRREAESTDDAATKEREAKRLKAAAAEEPKKEPKPGEAGYRWHASVPQPSKMDYTKRPESKVAHEGPVKNMSAGLSDGSKTSKINNKMTGLKQKGKKRNIHALKVSVEGRGVER